MTAMICPSCKRRCWVLYDRKWCADCCPYVHLWYREWVWM